MMKIAFNESLKTVILDNGRLKLYPKGSLHDKDRRQIEDPVALLPDVARFEALEIIKIRSLEETAKYDADIKRAAADAAAVVAKKAADDFALAKSMADAAAKTAADDYKAVATVEVKTAPLTPPDAPVVETPVVSAPVAEALESAVPEGDTPQRDNKAGKKRGHY
jgi:hypothetical protein